MTYTPPLFMKPLTFVSVVLPMRDAQQYLRPAVDSILAQTHRAFELILVDDGSTDETGAIASSYAARDSRVSVVRLPRTGLPSALNTGIAASRGAYIARMDADDVAYPDRLQKQVDYLDAHPDCVVLGSAVHVMDADGADLGIRHFAENHERITASLRLGTSSICHPASMIRRSTFIAVGGYDPDSYPSEDYALWLAMSTKGRLANLREPLLQYRRHENSVTVKMRAACQTATLRVANEHRASLGMPHLSHLLVDTPHEPGAIYHLDCARFALTGGQRRVALSHLAATWRREPRWLEPYLLFLALLLPRPILFWALSVRVSKRAAGPARQAKRNR